MKQKTQKGFSSVIAILLVLVIAGVGLAAWYVWQKNKNNNTKPTNQTSQNQNQPKTDVQKVVDPYEGWKTHSNSKYGISFRYPSDWRVEEVIGTSAPSSSAVLNVEYAINVKKNQEIKYNNTLSVEIFSATIEHVARVQDDLFAQSELNSVSKISKTLKDRQGISYKVTNGATTRRQYLIAVGSKVYLFTSLNEDSNSQSDSSYWEKFDKTFDSLKID